MRMTRYTRTCLVAADRVEHSRRFEGSVEHRHIEPQLVQYRRSDVVKVTLEGRLDVLENRLQGQCVCITFDEAMEREFFLRKICMDIRYVKLY